MANWPRYLVLLLALAFAAEASAQMGGKRGGRGGAKGPQREAIDLYQATADELRADLKLTTTQEPLWEAYVRKIEAFRADLARQRRPSKDAPADAPRALDRLVDVQRDRLTAVEDIADAGRALYKALGDEQRAIADVRLARLAAIVSQPTVPGNQ